MTRLIRKNLTPAKGALEPSHFTTWNADSAAYRPEYDERFEHTNWRALNGNLLYENSSRSDANALNWDASKTLNKSNGNCLGSTLNWMTNKLPLFGVVPFRQAVENSGFNIKSYKNGAYNMDFRDNITAPFLEGNSANSWNMARAYADAGLGKIINIKDDLDFNYKNYPIGTIFNIGDAHNYIGYDITHNPDGSIKSAKSKVDENGNVYPSHSFVLTGFDSKNGNTVPLLYDYGGIGYGTQRLYEGMTPTYAFIPNGYEHLTADNVMPRYLNYLNSILNSLKTLDALKLNNLDKAQELISQIKVPELQALNERYGVTNEQSINILKRLMGIGAQESELGYSLTGDKYSGVKSAVNSAKYKIKEAVPFLVSLTKDVTRIPTENEYSYYDKKAMWQHEMELYNKLLKSGKLEGKSLEQIQKIVELALIADKKNYPTIRYGEINPGYSLSNNHNNSRGIFLMKEIPNYEYTDSEGIKVSENIDDRYKGSSEVLKAYNRMLFNMYLLKGRYPDLNDELLLDAATIGWNSNGKVNNPEFIDFYIKNQKLKDSYLDKVKTHQRNIYKVGGKIFNILRIKLH